MATFTITGDDTLVLADRVITDLADNDNSSITFANNRVEVKTGKNQNTIFARNATGDNADLSIRVIRGSNDDNFLQGKIAESDRDFASTPLLSGSFVKRMGDGEGVVRNDTYTLTGGMIVKRVDGKENSDGDIEQAVSIYNIKFAQGIRSIQ